MSRGLVDVYKRQVKGGTKEVAKGGTKRGTKKAPRKLPREAPRKAPREAPKGTKEVTKRGTKRHHEAPIGTKAPVRKQVVNQLFKV